MEKSLQDKYELLDLHEAGPSGLKDSSSEYSSSGSDSEDDTTTIRENIVEDYENDLEQDLTKAVSSKAKKEHKEKRPKSRKLSKIPVHLKGLMGEANLRYARGDLETAEKMCYELIRQESHAFEPYVTLSQLYEMSDPEKSVQYLTIAAHLSKSNVDLWLRLAQIYIDKGSIKPAVTCFTRAITAQPKNYVLHMKRIQLLEVLDDQKYALRCKVKLLQMYSSKHYNIIMEMAKELAEMYHKQQDYAKAVEIFNIPFMKCPKQITPEMVNIYLELLLLNKSYPQCLDIFVQFCNIEIEVMLDDNNTVHVLSYNMPEGIQIDLQIKFIVCLVKLESFDLIDKLLSPLLSDETNVEKIGDLYLDVAEALMSMSRYVDALNLLIPLIKSKNFSLAAVWLKHAESLKECNMIEQAIESYYQVMTLAPQHIDVKHPLSDLLLENNRTDEALKIIKQDHSSLEIDVALLLKHMKLVQGLNMIDEYFEDVELLLKRHCIVFKHRSELRAVTYQESLKEKTQRINKIREFNEHDPVSSNITSVREPSVEEEYKIFQDILNFCYKNGHHKKLKQYAFSGLSSSRFKSNINEMIVYTMYACLLDKDSFHSYPIIKDIILRKTPTKNVLFWNILNLTMQTQDEFRQNRFLMRQNRNNELDFLRILQANSAISSGSYKIATIHLMPFLKSKPTPFIYLLMGVVFLQVSCQKHREIKKKLTQCAYGLLLNYAHKRGKAAYHEVCYNLGRLYHQYGILQLASYYYNLVLNFTHPLIEQYPDILCLKREAAYNLCLIYKDSENYIGARNLVIKYLTI